MLLEIFSKGISSLWNSLNSLLFCENGMQEILEFKSTQKLQSRSFVKSIPSEKF